MRYRRDVPRADQAAIDATVDHVRAHLSSVADADDDPNTHADDVRVQIVDHVDGRPDLLSIIGELDAEPDAPYMRDDYVVDDGIDRSQSALMSRPTDLDADAYAAHLEEKRARS